MNKYLSFLLLLLLSFFWTSCAMESSADYSPIDDDIAIEYSFLSGTQGWAADFCDYDIMANPMDSFQFRYEYSPLPTILNPQKSALKFQFNNVNNDVFVYTKNRYEGLMPNTVYEVGFVLELASKYSANNGGNAVFIKAGASIYEPQKVTNANYVSINLEKGNHSTDAPQASLLGDISSSANVYELINRASTKKIYVSTDSRGGMWFLIGFDAQKFGLTEIYLNKIRIFLKKV